MKSALEGDAKVDVEDLNSALADFIPHSTFVSHRDRATKYRRVLECTSRNILPEKYRNLDRSEVSRRAAEIATLVS